MALFRGGIKAEGTPGFLGCLSGILVLTMVANCDFFAPTDECGTHTFPTTPADLESMAGCWSRGTLDTTGLYFFYELHCFTVDSTLLRVNASRDLHTGYASEQWGEFKMHAYSSNGFSLKLKSAYRYYTLGNGETHADSTYPNQELGVYFRMGDSLVMGEPNSPSWCAPQVSIPIGKADEGHLKALMTYTKGPMGSKLRDYFP